MVSSIDRKLPVLLSHAFSDLEHFFQRSDGLHYDLVPNGSMSSAAFTISALRWSAL